jgi:hypothetical protein
MRKWKNALALAAATLFVTGATLPQSKPVATSATISCRAVEAGIGVRFGVQIVVFHYREAQDRDRLGRLLRETVILSVVQRSEESALVEASRAAKQALSDIQILDLKCVTFNKLPPRLYGIAH